MGIKSFLSSAIALIAIALGVVPSVASAGEPILHCEKTPCEFSVQSTGNSTLSSGTGATVLCTAITGSGSMDTVTGTTGKVTLTTHGCKEQDSGFQFACSSAGQPSGTIKTNTMVIHNISIESSTPGILLTGVSWTYTCVGGFALETVTGSLIGHVESACGVPNKQSKLFFEVSGFGQQKYKTTTKNPAFGEFDLMKARNHAESNVYVTAAIAATLDLNWNQTINLTC
jgi:hypothetical protein